MATTIEVEVMYNATDPETGTLLRKRTGLDSVHTLERENIWFIILSDDASSVRSSANARRTIDGTIVDRLNVVRWDDSDSGVAFVIRRSGGVCLAAYEESSWVWQSENDPFNSEVVASGIDPTFPKDAIVFHFVETPISTAHSSYADTLFDQVMF